MQFAGKIVPYSGFDKRGQASAFRSWKNKRVKNEFFSFRKQFFIYQGMAGQSRSGILNWRYATRDVLCKSIRSYLAIILRNIN